jgi:ubiquinone biosynthesis protein Coq4
MSKVRSRLVARLIGASVPLLNMFRRPKPFPFTLDELRELPPDTLGAETAAFLDQRRFGFLPMYETHDLIHSLLGYATTTTGELRLQAFMVGNRSASIAGRVLFLIGAVLLPELWGQLARDFHRGRTAQRLGALDWHKAVTRPSRVLRHQLRLAP